MKGRKSFNARVMVSGTALGLGLFAIPAVGSAQYYGPPGGLGMAYGYYQGGNALYQQQLRSRGVQNPPYIGSPQFFRGNFPRPSWEDYSRSTGGVFVRPRNCYGPYC